MSRRMLRAFEVRFPAVYKELQFFQWRLQGGARVVPHWLDPPVDAVSQAVVAELRHEGIAIRNHLELFSHNPTLYTEAVAFAQRVWEEASVAVQKEGEQALQRIYPEYAMRGDKQFKLHLLPPNVPVDHPFVRLALDQRLLGLANHYMGMRTYLRAVHLWWDRPTASPPQATQLWHRDLEDLMNVKVFIYFNDVSLDDGPFCFIPRSHARGSRRLLKPACDKSWRSSDEQIARVVPRSEWRICTGQTGTVILCDTSGYHKGLKPERGDRLMLILQYTAGEVAAKATRTFTLLGKPDGVANPIRRWALELHPERRYLWWLSARRLAEDQERHVSGEQDY